MKFINKYICITAAVFGLFTLHSCDDELELKIPYPNDITFNELELGRFAYKISDSPFTSGDSKSGIVTVNVSNTGGSTYSGFALSNKSQRSYPWNLSPDFAPAGGLTVAETQQSIDSTAFSVSTVTPNRTENYLVGHAAGDDAFFTLNEPAIVSHVLVANTSYNYLMASYGSVYSGTFDSDSQAYLIDGTAVRNIKNPNPSSTRYGRFLLPSPSGVNAVRLSGHEILEKRKAGETAKTTALNNGSTDEEAEEAYETAYADLSAGYIKLNIEGSLNGSTTGNVEFYLATRENVDLINPTYNFVLEDWTKVDLSSLGEVDKVLFKISSSYVDDFGNMIYSTTFCLDGIRLK